MFTGIVTDIGEIIALTPTAQGQLHRLRIACRYDRAGIADGASIACNGVCLTVVGSGVEGDKTWFEVDAAAETLGMTTAKHWTTGTELNLERALKIGDELGGHIVAGHADGIAAIVSRDDLPDMARFVLSTTRELARFVAAKGSVTLDGVSLTVNTVQDVQFSVLIIPHTLAVTTLGGWRGGAEVNIEVDLMARYAARLAEMQ
jgi:riboflavin synthase